MANYFQGIFSRVHALDSKDESLATSPFKWYIIPPPPNLQPIYPYDASAYSYPIINIASIITDDLCRDLHFTPKLENNGDEGLYGLLHYCQFPEVEVGLDIDIAAFIAGAISCTCLGLLLDDIYKPRKFLAWWPTRSLNHFLEEGIYLGRCLKWLVNVCIIISRVIARATYGGITHIMCRWMYYCLRNLVTMGKIPYTPLVDDTFASLISGYLWTRYTLESEVYTAYDRIICVGWNAAFTGLLESFFYQYFLKDPPPGLFRWVLGGAFYGPGIFQYFVRDN